MSLNNLQSIRRYQGCTTKSMVWIVKGKHPHHTHVAIKQMERKRKRKQVIFGLVPLTLSQIFHLFLKHGGQISVQVTGKRWNKGIGLEIPAMYTFCHKKDLKILKLKELLNDRNFTGYCTWLLLCFCIKFNVLFKLYLSTDTVISLYQRRFYARCAKSSLLYREYCYVEDRYIGILSHMISL